MQVALYLVLQAEKRSEKTRNKSSTKEALLSMTECKASVIDKEPHL